MRRLVLGLVVLAGCQGAEGVPPDDENAVAIPGGKADESGFEECALSAVVAHLNSGVAVESLQADGLHTRAARNLVAHRDGADAVFGTEDDDLFEDIASVDDVPWVGPVAVEQLVAMVACATTQHGEVEVIFSPQPYADSHLARAVALLDAAESHLDIAMYSLSDGGVMDALERAAGRGLSIRMIYDPANGEHLRTEGTRSAELEEMGIDVRYVNQIMHHKFVLIDGPRGDATRTDGVLMTGSGNWSNSAGVRYDENTLVMRGHAESLLRYQREFDHLWANSRDIDWNPDITRVDVAPIDEAAIAAVDGEGTEAFFTSANFETTDSTRYGRGFRVVRGRNAIADRLVALIASAEHSIRVASGHLRSRPVSDALIAAVAANPSLDVRVYLDSQEFVSAGSHGYQVAERDECLADATTDNQVDDCWDRGFLYAYALHVEGIDVRFKHYSYHWHYSYAPQMHHKYIVVDERVVATGSYNLSDNAEHGTMENIVVLDAAEHPDVVQRYVDNFDALYETNRDGDALEALYTDIADGDGFPIVYDAMSLTWDQVDALKSAMREACPAIDSGDYRSHPERHYRCVP